MNENFEQHREVCCRLRISESWVEEENHIQEKNEISKIGEICGALIREKRVAINDEKVEWLPEIPFENV